MEEKKKTNSDMSIEKTDEKEKKDIDFVEEFSIEDVWTTGCALNTTGKIDN